jgi:hypothetical protein
LRHVEEGHVAGPAVTIHSAAIHTNALRGGNEVVTVPSAATTSR